MVYTLKNVGDVQEVGTETFTLQRIDEHSLTFLQGGKVFVLPNGEEFIFNYSHWTVFIKVNGFGELELFSIYNKVAI